MSCVRGVVCDYMQDTEGVQRKVRAAKSREHQLRQEGMTGTRAGKAAIKAVSAVKTTKQKKKSDKRCPSMPISRWPHLCCPAKHWPKF